MSDDLVKWLRQEAADWEILDNTEAGTKLRAAFLLDLRAGTKLRAAATEIERLREALRGGKDITPMN